MMRILKLNKIALVMACALAIASTEIASAGVMYSTDTTLTTGTIDRFFMEGDITVTVPAGETVLVSSADRYPSSYTDNGAPSSNTLDVYGTLNFDTGHALGAGDWPVSDEEEGTINIHETGVINTALLFTGTRMKSTVNIWGTLNVNRGGTNTGGTSYGASGPSIYMRTGLEPEGDNFINQYPGSHVEAETGDKTLNLSVSGNAGGEYNMMGGTLIVADILNGTSNPNMFFNFSGGTVIIEGQDRTDVINESWWNGAASALFDGVNTTITIPEPGGLLLLSTGCLAMLFRRRR